MATPLQKRRIFELDLLRGLFIIIIIIDHLQLWPSPFRFISGEGRLWVSAAEGFFLISGLLIGYIRGYKGRNKPLLEVSKLLWRRAFMLYVWGVIVTVLLLVYTLLIGSNALLPDLPNSQQLSSYPNLIFAVVSSNYFNGWIYFLRLYAIMLAVTPLFLYLLRKKKEWLIMLLMAGAYAFSFVYPEGGLQWQLFFFGAALIGYRLESIASWLRARPTTKASLTWSTIAVTLITMIISYYYVFLVTRDNGVAVRDHLASLFSLNPVSIWRVGLAFLWFSGLLLLIHRFRGTVMKYARWLLVPLGEASLSGYILQALIVPVIVVIVPHTDNQIINTLVPILLVLLIWWLLKQKLIKKVIPR